MVISLILGRSEPEDSEIPAFECAKILHDEFKEKFKATCCRVLTKDVTWGAPEHHTNCIKYVDTATRITYNLLKDKLNKL